MQRLEVSGAVRPLYGSLGVKGLTHFMMQPTYGRWAHSVLSDATTAVRTCNVFQHVGIWTQL